MSRKDYAIKPFVNMEISLGWNLTLILRKGFATEDELKNAPGIQSALDVTSDKTNETLQTFLVKLDPLYETQEEAQTELRKWLDEKSVRLDKDVWEQE